MWCVRFNLYCVSGCQRTLYTFSILSRSVIRIISLRIKNPKTHNWRIANPPRRGLLYQFSSILRPFLAVLFFLYDGFSYVPIGFYHCKISGTVNAGTCILDYLSNRIIKHIDSLCYFSTCCHISIIFRRKVTNFKRFEYRIILSFMLRRGK